MKTKLLFLVLLSTITVYSQTQIGADIDGEVSYELSGTIVSLSSDGNTVAIGAPYNYNNGTSAGHVRVYQNMSGIWTQIGQDINGQAHDNLGKYLSLSSDGNTLAIGRPLNSFTGAYRGYVRIYQNISGDWTQIGADINGEGANDYSGSSVCLSANGTAVAIGSPGNNGNGISSGQVRIYQNMSGVWTQIGQDINGEAVYNESGRSVSLSADATTVAIGAPGNNANGDFSGHVRIYKNISGTWTQIGADIDGEATYDYSGGKVESVSLSSDGNTVAIGARGNYGNDTGYNSGHVRVYQNLSDVWMQIGGDIDAEAADNQSGTSVSLSSDGGIVAIGALYNAGNGGSSGHVRLYQNSSDVWTQLGPDIDGEAAGDQSGTSVSLSSDGSIVAIGAPYNDGNISDSGHVRVYDLSALLSIVDNEIAKNFTVYPNPVNKQLQLQLSPTLEFKTATIYNYYGQLVLQSNTTKINVSNLSSGIYFLEIETNKGKGVKKIVKK